jgi:hypothetical protein
MQSVFPLQIQTFSETVELQQKCHNLPNLILLSAIEESKEASANDGRRAVLQDGAHVARRTLGLRKAA